MWWGGCLEDTEYVPWLLSGPAEVGACAGHMPSEGKATTDHMSHGFPVHPHTRPQACTHAPSELGASWALPGRPPTRSVGSEGQELFLISSLQTPGPGLGKVLLNALLRAQMHHVFSHGPWLVVGGLGLKVRRTWQEHHASLF